METTMLVGERFFADKLTLHFKPLQHGDIISFNSPVYSYSTNPVQNLFERYAWGPESWTKRIIGIPGDEIRGVIEDGKSVLYRNGVKLDEPYLNKFPLVAVRDRASTFRGDASITPKSYDSSYSFQEQPFYKLDNACVLKDLAGSPLLTDQTIGRPSPRRALGLALPEGKNYYDGSDEFYVKLGENQYWCMGDNRKGSQDCRFVGPIDGKLIHGKILFRLMSIDAPGEICGRQKGFVPWIKSFLFVDMALHPIDFWSRVRWNRFFQVVR
jgi:signal peptidase I